MTLSLDQAQTIVNEALAFARAKRLMSFSVVVACSCRACKRSAATKTDSGLRPDAHAQYSLPTRITPRILDYVMSHLSRQGGAARALSCGSV